MNNTPKIAIMGASGRMGRMLIAAVLEAQKRNAAQLVGSYVRADSSLIGIDAGELIGADKCGINLTALPSCINDTNSSNGANNLPDVLIDFSLPDALSKTLAFCQAHAIAMVVGITGLTDAQETLLRNANLPIVYAGNYSIGINLTTQLAAHVASVYGLAADVEITEVHHKHKLDAPSGTALMLAQAVLGARGQDSAAIVNGRAAGTAKRQNGEIGIHALRGGEVIGEHTVAFMLEGEILEITHKAQSRMAFAQGAVRAALWVVDKAAGVADMQSVLADN